jgi:hypothetical protein
MAHDSWPRCETCKGVGFGCPDQCDGGRVRPPGWNDETQAVDAPKDAPQAP